MKRAITFLSVAMLAFASSFCHGQLLDPGTGGKAGGPIDLLFLRGNVEISFGTPVPIDPILLEKLAARGFRVTVARDFNPLTVAYLKQFNCVIWVNPSPYGNASRLLGPVGWHGGMHLLTVARNAELVRQYVEGGGGLLINVATEEAGMAIQESHNLLLSAYDLATECGQVRDKQHQVEFDKVLNVFPRYIHYTKMIGKHPATEGVTSVFYPGYGMRWDDNVTTLPLYPRDKAWTVLVAAEPSATVSWFRGTPYEKGHWKDAPDRPTPAIAVARDFGKGRVGVISIGHFFLYYFPYSKGPHAEGAAFWECNFGYQDGWLMEKGSGQIPSDVGLLLDNLYCWLSEPGVTAGFGGYDESGGVKLSPIPDQPMENRSEVWADRDPMVTGPVRPMRILVGARSAASDGTGSPADWAKAAKSAGIDVVAFTERFEDTTAATYASFVADCAAASDAGVLLLPGVDIEDSLGNRFLLLGKATPVRDHLLVEKEEDAAGKRLIWTGHMVLGMGEVLSVAARPARLATIREKGALPPELYSHCCGVAVATYDATGALVDDGMFAYRWHVFNGSLPIPVAVHEVMRPGQLRVAAETGLQCYVNSDTPAHAAAYFKQGWASYGGNPMRYYVSSGPTFKSVTVDGWNKSPWSISAQATGPVPIVEVSLVDQRGSYRRFLPHSTSVDLSCSGGLGAQHWFLTELLDADGGRAILSPIRTLPGRNFARCMDRQNWFGGLHPSLLSYTGRMRSLPKTRFLPSITVPGVTLASTLCPKLNLTYAGLGHVITDYRIDATLVPGGRATGADSSPTFNCLPIDVFDANLRYIFHMNMENRGAVTPPYVIHEVTIRTKKDLKSTGAVWPIIGKVGPAAPYVYTDAAGERVRETVPADGYVDLPVGAAVQDLVILTPLRVSGKGDIGFPSPGDGVTVVAGQTYRGSLIGVNGKNLDAIRNSMGFDGATPYQLDITQGKLDRIAAAIHLLSDDSGVAGTVKGAEMPAWHGAGQVPLRLAGASPSWPVGLWRSDNGTITEFGVFEGMALGRLDVRKDTAFYFGNLLIASDPDLNLAFTGEWTQDGVRMEVHNPTDKPITATVRTAAAVRDRRPYRETVTVPAGTTVRVGAGVPAESVGF